MIVIPPSSCLTKASSNTPALCSSLGAEFLLTPKGSGLCEGRPFHLELENCSRADRQFRLLRWLTEMKIESPVPSLSLRAVLPFTRHQKIKFTVFLFRWFLRVGSFFLWVLEIHIEYAREFQPPLRHLQRSKLFQIFVPNYGYSSHLYRPNYFHKITQWQLIIIKCFYNTYALLNRNTHHNQIVLLCEQNFNTDISSYTVSIGKNSNQTVTYGPQ